MSKYIQKLLIIFIFFTSLQHLSGTNFNQTGVASWYGPNFHGKRTASGEIFNTYDLTAAHKTLPFNSIIKVISLENNSEIIVRINDRGPFAKGRILDLSKAAAAKLGLIKCGTMKVKITLLEKGDNKYYRYSKYAGKSYTIQLASFSKKELAENFIAELKNKNIETALQSVRIKNKNYYRIIIAGLNYHALQNQKRILHTNGISNYLIKES